ncbi:MAG TPA: hypothetical protein VN238_20310, partial [Solirubrobacteraceae bacterium]|nr:hypothetical protein [Solirubrobacteraceae bacterium]
MNATLAAFGYPATALAEYEWWAVLLRPQQVTAGSMVLASRHDATALGGLPAEAWGELATVCTDLEAALATALRHDKVNYLALMMVDPHVHFHVLPRYAEPREVAGARLVDAAWPGPPDVTAA